MTSPVGHVTEEPISECLVTIRGVLYSSLSSSILCNHPRPRTLMARPSNANMWPGSPPTIASVWSVTSPFSSSSSMATSLPLANCSSRGAFSSTVTDMSVTEGFSFASVILILTCAAPSNPPSSVHSTLIVYELLPLSKSMADALFTVKPWSALFKAKASLSLPAVILQEWSLFASGSSIVNVAKTFCSARSSLTERSMFETVGSSLTSTTRICVTTVVATPWLSLHSTVTSWLVPPSAS